MSQFKRISKAAISALAGEVWTALRLFYYGILLGAGALVGAATLISLLPQ